MGSPVIASGTNRKPAMRSLRQPQSEFEEIASRSLMEMREAIQTLSDQLYNLTTLLTHTLQEIRKMADNQAQLDASIAALQAQDATLQSMLTKVAQDINSVVTILQSKAAAVSGSAPAIDLTTEVNQLQTIGNDLGSIATNLQTLDTKVNTEANPPPAESGAAATVSQ